MSASRGVAAGNLRAARWTAAEDELILANIEHPPAHIAKRLQYRGRTRVGIGVRGRTKRRGGRSV